MVEYLEKMIPHADWSFLVLGMDLEGRIWSSGLRGKGELVRERKRKSERCFNVWGQNT